MTKTLRTIAAAILLTGSIMIVDAADKKKHQDPLLAKYQGIEKKIKSAVEAGKLSAGDAKKKLIGAKKEIWGAVKKGKVSKKKWDSKKDSSNKGEELKRKYQAMEEKIWAGVKAGKLSKKDAEKKLASLKKEIWGGAKKGKASKKQDPDGNKKDPRDARYHEAEKEIIGAVKAGKISRADAGKKLAALKGQLWGGDTNKPRGKEGAEKQLDTPRAKYQAVAKRIAIAVKEGKISKTDGEKRLSAYRKQLRADSKASSRAGKGAGAGAGKGAGKGAGAGAGKGAGAGAGKGAGAKAVENHVRSDA
jgi:hypothetical protein